MNVADCLTHIDNPEDVPYLRTKLLDVNLRLFKSNPAYKSLVLAACDMLKAHCMTKMDGYKLPHGVSGANLGIPWNIIVYARERGTIHAFPVVMINPEITSSSPEMEETESNCGSIRLDKPIKVKRHRWVDVRWYDHETDIINHRIFTVYSCGYTIQHEIDHNLGILITDRQVQ